ARGTRAARPPRASIGTGRTWSPERGNRRVESPLGVIPAVPAANTVVETNLRACGSAKRGERLAERRWSAGREPRQRPLGNEAGRSRLERRTQPGSKARPAGARGARTGGTAGGLGGQPRQQSRLARQLPRSVAAARGLADAECVRPRDRPEPRRLR